MEDNVFIGIKAGAKNIIGDGNVCIANLVRQGNNNIASDNVFIGKKAGNANSTWGA